LVDNLLFLCVIANPLGGEAGDENDQNVIIATGILNQLFHEKEKIPSISAGDFFEILAHLLIWFYLRMSEFCQDFEGFVREILHPLDDFATEEEGFEELIWIAFVAHFSSSLFQRTPFTILWAVGYETLCFVAI